MPWNLTHAGVLRHTLRKAAYAAAKAPGCTVTTMTHADLRLADPNGAADDAGPVSASRQWLTPATARLT